MKKQNQDSESELLPEVELLFLKAEHAQKAAAALTSPKLKKSKISIRSMLFEDRGRTLKLTFNSTGAHLSEILSFLSALGKAASIARPLRREISISLVQKAAVVPQCTS